MLAERYRLGKELGRGGMATVYLARDLKHDRDVAVKVIRSDLSASLGHERFLREIEIAARLRHPNIVPLFDSGEVEGSLFFVMRLMSPIPVAFCSLVEPGGKCTTSCAVENGTASRRRNWSLNA